ncbi:Hint domain-containing protein [Komagataeibacter sp. FNDCR2]|uniref:Hint domain-containing protein n=1 Tax=Komagataeibacter sp. FNDCR2 TaxID=2878682 RepID=UPI001E59B5DE|nr:Hint domain-containing protein [Komagataeibacter sp. FNDCR2]MCE2575382.1 Hint domain-containing protein [Komagataeibacter sp. FNDCR2]
MTSIGNEYFNTGNTITQGGSYTLAPVAILGVAGNASVDVVSTDGDPVTASISLNGLLDSSVTALSTYTITAEKNTYVTVSTGTVALGTTVVVNADGGSANLAGGLLTAVSGITVNISNGGTFDGNGMISAVTGLTLNFGNGGGTLNLVGSSDGLALLDGASINGFGAGDNIIVESNGATATVSDVSYDALFDTSTITFSNGDTLELNGSYQDTDPSASNYLATVADKNGVGTVLVCFLSGSMVHTARGEVAIEDVRIGDEVLVPGDGPQVFRPVSWVGSQSATVRPGPYPDEAGYPVRILKDAIAQGVPYKDMLITPEHCLFLEGCFIPVRMLVNNRSIYYDLSITSYTYYHLETAHHSIITVDGVLTESYLDTGNRHGFRQTGAVVGFPGQEKTWARDSAAPLGVAVDVVRPVFEAIAARALASNIAPRYPAMETTGDADLHLVTDSGVTIRSMHGANGFAFFMIPPCVHTVRIMSRTSRPSDTVGPYVDDRRHFGVLVRNIKLFEGNVGRSITSHLAPAAPDGWHGGESPTSRWTDGQALLELGARNPASIGLLCMEIPVSGPYRVAAETAHGPARLTA